MEVIHAAHLLYKIMGYKVGEKSKRAKLIQILVLRNKLLDYTAVILQNWDHFKCCSRS